MRAGSRANIKNGVLIVALSKTPEARKKHKTIAGKMA
jgi:HSP20 family molecular chaperone IbpA